MRRKAITHPFVLVALLGLLVTVQSGCDKSKRLADEKDLASQKAAEDGTIATSLTPDVADGKAKEDAKTTTDSKAAVDSVPTVDSVPARDSVPTGDSEKPTFESTPEQQDPDAEKPKVPEKPTIEIGDNWTRLSAKREIWIDKKKRQVMFSGIVCFRDGPLEMFICPARTKEHESVIAANCESSEVHIALLLAKINPGKPCSWDPEYRPAHGPTIEATIKWRDEKTKKTKSQNAKEWIRNSRTKKPMEEKWIFGGSTFWTDPDTGQEVYYADAGELICLSNFSTAMIDVGVESSQSNDGLLFETLTENIPPIGTKVYVILEAGPPVAPEKKVVKKDDQAADADSKVPTKSKADITKESNDEDGQK